MKLLRLAAFAAAVSLAACSSSPTSSARTGAANPSLDGTSPTGSGAYPNHEGQGVASDTTSTPPERGGASLGSGN